MDRVLGCMVSDSVGAGAANRELCAASAEYLGAAGGVAVAAYCGALLAALDALELAPGDAVVVSALAPQVYRDALARRGLAMRQVDVDPATGTLLADQAAREVASGARAIVAHYTLGFVPDMPRLLGLGVPVIEDLSQGLGANLGERRCGSLGRIAVFSLSPDSIVTGGGGAMVMSQDKALARRLQDLAEVRLAPLADLNASLALAQLREIEKFIDARRQIAAAFARGVARTRHKALVQGQEGENVHYSFPVMLASGMKDVRQYARKKGVETAPGHHESLLAQGGDGEAPGAREWPAARSALMRCLLFPLYPSLGKTRVDAVARVLATLP
jgi:dTDP-4-amino-4,6-dideoxygalactose transaminase